MADPLPVTVFFGTQGTDGSRVLDRILQKPDELRIAAIVPRRGKKRKGLRQNVSVLPTTERLVRLGQGCACCTVRGDLMAKIKRLAEEKKTDHIVIQAGAHTDLEPLTKTFTVAGESGEVLSDVANIETIVVVVDAGSFINTLASNSARPLIERIELANVIVLEGCGDLATEESDRVNAAMNALNPEARIEMADDERFTLHASREEGSGGSGPASGSSVERFSYQARRPFHPARLHALLGDPLEGVIRVQGSFWVASQPDLAGSMDIAGASRSISCGGMWWASVPAEKRPDNPDFQQYLKNIWHPEFGDRFQDLMFVGVNLDEEALNTGLEQCLLTAEELADRESWQGMEDPFDWPEA